MSEWISVNKEMLSGFFFGIAFASFVSSVRDYIQLRRMTRPPRPTR